MGGGSAGNFGGYIGLVNLTHTNSVHVAYKNTKHWPHPYISIISKISLQEKMALLQ